MKEGRSIAAFRKSGRNSFAAEWVPLAQFLRDVRDRDIWGNQTAGLGDATLLHDGFPGAWDDLGRVVGNRQLGLGLGGKHGCMLANVRWRHFDVVATA